MTTELIGQALTQTEEYRRPAVESPLAQVIRESAMRVSRYALGADGVRYVESFIRLDMGIDPHTSSPAFEQLRTSPLSLDRQMPRALAGMNAVTVAECEALAQRYGL